MKTITEAAKILGVSTRRIYQFVKDGRLSVFHVGFLMIVDEKRLEELKNAPRPVGRPKNDKTK